MDDYTTELERAIIQHYGIPWPEIDGAAYVPMVPALNAYGQLVIDNGWAANKHLQRLVSSGQGEALTALWDRWVQVMDQDMAPLPKSAAALSGLVGLIPDTIATLKLTIAAEAGQLAVRNAITLTVGALTFNTDVGEAAAALDAEKTRNAVAGQVESAARSIRQQLKSLLTDQDVAALETVPADLTPGSGGGIAAGAAVAAGGAVGGALSGGTEAPGAGIKVDHEEHRLAARNVIAVAGDVTGATTGQLTAATDQHAAARGSGSFAEAIAPDIDLVLERLAAATAAVGGYLNGPLPEAILRISGDQLTTDDGNRKNFGTL